MADDNIKNAGGIYRGIKERKSAEVSLDHDGSLYLLAQTQSYRIHRNRETGTLYIETTDYHSGILVFPKECLEYLALSDRYK